MARTPKTDAATRSAPPKPSGARVNVEPAQAPMKTAAPQPLHTPGPIGDNSAAPVAAALNGVLADAFVLYTKTKNFHWHMSGSHFRDYHLLLDEQATQIFEITDDVAERVRKIGQRTLTSIGAIARNASLTDNDAEFVGPREMLSELMEDNRKFVDTLNKAHKISDDADDYATNSLIEVWLDEAERRVWFLFETARALERETARA